MNYTRNIRVSKEYQGGNPKVAKLVKVKNDDGINFYFIVDNIIVFKSDLESEAESQYKIFVEINEYTGLCSSMCNLDLY
jgi:hypothetical protein